MVDAMTQVGACELTPADFPHLRLCTDISNSRLLRWFESDRLGHDLLLRPRNKATHP